MGPGKEDWQRLSKKRYKHSSTGSHVVGLEQPQAVSGSGERENHEGGSGTNFGGPSMPNHEAFGNLERWNKSRISRSLRWTELETGGGRRPLTRAGLW